MTSVENVMYIDNNSWEFNSKPRFDRIIDHADVLYFMCDKNGEWEEFVLKIVILLSLGMEHTNDMNTLFSAQVSITRWDTLRQGRNCSLSIHGFFFGNTFQVIHSIHKVTTFVYSPFSN